LLEKTLIFVSLSPLGVDSLNPKEYLNEKKNTRKETLAKIYKK